MKNLLIIIFFLKTYLAFGQIDTFFLGEGSIDIVLTKKNSLQIEQEVQKMNKRQMDGLKQLSLRGDFDSIPSFVFRFSNIEEIEINSTNKISLPKGFNQLSGLISIRVNSELSSISDNIVLTKIEHLYIYKYTSKSFPKAICTWKNLIEIEIQRGEFAVLPIELCDLNHLKRLNLSDNKIRVLPDEIGKLQNIEVLAVGKNCLVSIPNTICDLKKLRELYVLENPKLKIMPEQLSCIKSLPSFETLYDN